MRPHLVCDDQPLRWNLLAPTIGYVPGFVDTRFNLRDRIFDHGAIVKHGSGQLAFFGDPYETTREEVELFAFKHGCTVDHYGDGCWYPRNTSSLVLRITDPKRAITHLVRYGCYEPGWAVFEVVFAKRYLPAGTDVKALRKRYPRDRAAEAAGIELDQRDYEFRLPDKVFMALQRERPPIEGDCDE